MIDNQFYPTPAGLAIKAWSKFKNRDIVRLLEPSAGRGDLLESVQQKHHLPHSIVDCIEIDSQNCAILKDAGFNIIDHDFLSFQGQALYSHILMNPVFRNGVDHVLHAWDILQDGELVAVQTET